MKSVYVASWYEVVSLGSKHQGRDGMSNEAGILVPVVFVQQSPPRCQRVTNGYRTDSWCQDLSDTCFLLLFLDAEL